MAELRMLMTEIAVRVVRPAEVRFATLPLSRQISAVRPLLLRHNAIAATWLSALPPDLLLLHLVAVSTGRALVRMVETKLKKGSEANLALAARELLGTAYLFDMSRTKAPRTPLAGVVDSVRRKVAPPPSPSPSPPKRRAPGRWTFVTSAVLSGEVMGAIGPSLWPGLSLSLELRLVRGLSGRVGLTYCTGPLGRASPVDAEIDGLGLAPGLQLMYMWRFGRVTLGPALGLQAWWTRAVVNMGGQTWRFTRWTVKLSADFELRVRLSRSLSLLGGVGLQASPRQDIYDRLSDARIVYATPHLGWSASLGLLIRLD